MRLPLEQPDLDDVGHESRRLDEMLQRGWYHGYTYAYPHKTAYRSIGPWPLREVWEQHPEGPLFLYVHIPFCEQRCGFCNLFTTTRPDDEMVEAYLEALERQATVTARAVERRTFASFALGGGTPTWLQPEQLHRVFDVVEKTMGADLAEVPASGEVSPATATRSKLAVYRERGIDRVSMGVQSFVPQECSGVFRRQDNRVVETAVLTMHELGFGTVNLDLMYGLPEQTEESWLLTLHRALELAPDELYLYPLYVRELTRMGRRKSPTANDLRPRLYTLACQLLRDEGFTQTSMRMFRRRAATSAPSTRYRCQRDGMVGLGCGARSYTRGVHYSNDFAVGPKYVKSIIADYVRAPDAAHDKVGYGFALDGEDRRRRYAILSLLTLEEGLDLGTWSEHFGTVATGDLPELTALLQRGFAAIDQGVVRLTSAGIARSDAIGPWLYSPKVDVLMQQFELK